MEMTLAEYLFTQFSTAQYIEFCLRILVACFCGAVIGFERSMRLKEAGIRTHIIVCFASALLMIVSKYGFGDLVNEAGSTYYYGTHATDPARIAAQVVSGISFLGAGIIFRSGTSIRGLTTAAGVWATAGIGLSIGAGLYLIGIFATVVIAILQYIMHRFVISADSLVVGKIHCKVLDYEEFRPILNKFIDSNNIQIFDSRVAVNEDGSANYDLSFRMNKNIPMKDLTDFFASHKNVQEVRCEFEK